MKPVDRVPLTERVRTAVLEAILNKHFDRRLPSEETLAQMLNVSRTTIRAALQSLEQDGIISRKRAIGTTINAHVRPAALALQRMVGFDTLLRERGYDVEVKVEWERGLPSAAEVEDLGVPADQDSMLTAKSYFANGSLAIGIADVMPWDILRDEDFDGDVDASIFEFTSAACTKAVDHAVAEIVPALKSDDQSTKLPLQPGTPFIRLHEYHYARKGDRIAVSTIDVDNAFFHFEVFRRRWVEL